jgi:hypothetical protein
VEPEAGTASALADGLCLRAKIFLGDGGICEAGGECAGPSWASRRLFVPCKVNSDNRVERTLSVSGSPSRDATELSSVGKHEGFPVEIVDLVGDKLLSDMMQRFGYM